jgi:hypothetical protein
MTATTSNRNRHDSNPALGTPAERATGGTVSSLLPSIGILLLGAVALLLADAMLRSPGAIEQAFMQSIQVIEFPGMTTLASVMSSLTTTLVFVGFWAALLAFSALRRRWGSMVALAVAPAAAVMTAALAHLIANPLRPESVVLEQSTGFVSILTSPAGQIAATIMLAGLAVSVLMGDRSRRIQVASTVIAFVPASVAVFGHIWAGSLWPSEAITTASLAVLLVIPLVWSAQRIDARLTGIPLVSAAPVPHKEEKPHAHALTSTILFNGETVSKIYRPGFLPRAIYWMAFQAEFPYMRNRAALNAAVHRRNLIGQLTEYWYGESHVARAIGVDEINGRLAITSDFVDGSEPTDREKAREFLIDLVGRFEEAGLPTWQIDYRQPRALDNVMETKDGRYCVVDLESGLVSPLASPKSWSRAIKRGLFPMYDDIFFDVTLAYIREHEPEMRTRFGDDWVNRLYSTLNATESETRRWHDSEPRVWSRLLGRKRTTRKNNERLSWAIQWFDDAIASWQAERKISSTEARVLRSKVRSPQFVSVLPHFGVHLGTGVLLRFPLGSIARSGYTGFNLLRVTWQYLTKRIDRDEWREAVGVHSPLVLMISAIPGFGAFAYLASKPIRSDHLLLHVAVDAVMLKVPFRLYERFGLRRIVLASPEYIDRFIAVANRRSMPSFAWAEEHRHHTDREQATWSSTGAEGAAIRSIY